MKKIKTLGGFVEDFYRENKEVLEANYPGIGPGRLLQTFVDFLGRGEKQPALFDRQDPLLQRLLFGEPLEYLTGEAFFFTSRFFVNRNVLIPRSETELLVEDALALIKKNDYKTFADIGAGSGCVALSILGEVRKPLRAFAVDISEDALKVCSINAFRHQGKFFTGSELALLKGDRAQPLPEKLDLIVSNPPYIDRDADREDVHFQTDLWEPAEALYLNGRTYREWFEEFFENAYHKLNPGGAFLMEGHENKLEGLIDPASAFFDRVEIGKDYAGRDRFLRGFKDE